MLASSCQPPPTVRAALTSSPPPAVTLCRLPPKFRSNLASVYVLHCDLLLWAASAALLPWLSGQMWRKVTWISRLECLWDYVNKVGQQGRLGWGGVRILNSCARTAVVPAGGQGGIIAGAT